MEIEAVFGEGYERDGLNGQDGPQANQRESTGATHVWVGELLLRCFKDWLAVPAEPNFRTVSTRIFQQFN